MHQKRFIIIGVVCENSAIDVCFSWRLQTNMGNKKVRKNVVRIVPYRNIRSNIRFGPCFHITHIDTAPDVQRSNNSLPFFGFSLHTREAITLTNYDSEEEIEHNLINFVMLFLPLQIGACLRLARTSKYMNTCRYLCI